MRAFPARSSAAHRCATVSASTSPDGDPTGGPPSFSEEQADGAALYGQRCASCHEGGQVARAPARDVIAALPPDRIVAALETGTMRVQGESLTPEQRRAVATYLSTSRTTPAASAAAAPAVAPRCEASGPLRTTAADWRNPCRWSPPST